MEFLLVGTMILAGSMLVFLGASGLSPIPQPPSRVSHFTAQSRGFVSGVRLRRARRSISHTDVILADLLSEVAELRREIADLRSSESY